MDTKTKKAADLQVGDQVVEKDGAVLTVALIVPEKGYINLSLSSTMQTDIFARVHKNAMIRVV